MNIYIIMNYLLNFKLFESNSSYQEISYEDYDRLTIGVSNPEYDNWLDDEYTNYDESRFISENWVEFTTAELDKIKELVPDAQFSTKIRNDKSKARIDADQTGLVMVKLKDEWYYVLIDMSDKAQEDVHFQCDQFDGLIKLIRDYVV